MGIARPGLPVVLFLVLGGVWAANAAGIVALGSEDHSYPVTAYPMFSAQPQRFVRDYYVDVVPEEGQPPVRLPAPDLYHPQESLFEVHADWIHRGVLGSFLNRCPGYQVRGYGQCDGDAGEAWEVPAGIATVWTTTAQARLDLAAAPVEMTFVTLTRDVDAADPEAPWTEERHFAWHPEQGRLTYAPANDGTDDREAP